MATLKEKIKKIIALHGPISVSQYMTLTLTDPQFGYYRTQTPFGSAGDFITAPEISQLFGEMIGIWLLASWKAHGCPHPFIVAEIGPGRGTLMSDILRTMQKLSSTAFNSAEVFLIEISEKLAKEQKKSLAPYQKQIHIIENFNQIPSNALFFIANEFLDTLPVNQYIKIDGEWRERRITVNQDGDFIFIAAPRRLPSSCLQSYCSGMPDGTIFEHAPSRHQFVQQLSNHLMQVTGSALLIDYGARELAFGDTLQALSKHKFRDIFDAPGQHDLTSHVDFSFLKDIALEQGCFIEILEQGDFLLKMGLLERAQQLGANKNAPLQDKIRQDVERLAGPDQMGKLFKVLHMSDKNIPVPPRF
ncbi:class I SAM-dependent methyltransferase [Bartonella krasnovii]|uniref:SAM-dependent methyltransferase n=1 Tax=Bartonella krasnovii TaxID=2267275 RepID=A0ABY3VVW1_9HYPH|nr:SAM-dependent methyltransferase [Bartonella krasnovii]UNF29521.1 SAM-dependent methyltransferase [Bartonella krasnovii]UNF35879.1 SAM-dependent methyltransferase [Bartonella krasnovii]UNF37499.1 SAM-dependent methyltransferase [Bartonella krasnovii]UNF39283.1 SAM-dependent methyltransferase [Bartonella krasnovii]UNF40919.1 SAM-dependent methyltransferase [Bartonella krasnovii]